MADLGIYFGEDEDDTQMELDEDRDGQDDLSYLVVANDQDDSFDNVDTETLLAEMTNDSSQGQPGLEEGANLELIIEDTTRTAVEKAHLLANAAWSFQRSFLAKHLTTLLAAMEPRDAIDCVIPIHIAISHEDPIESQEQESTGPSEELSIPHNIFTPIFIDLLLDQNAEIAHQTRLAVVTVAENVAESVLESEILNGIMSGLERLYTTADGQDISEAQSQDENGISTIKDDQDGEAELGKMLVVVLLTALSNVLGQERCLTIVLPTLDKLVKHSQFYVRKEIVMALGTLCKIVPQDIVVSQLLPLFDMFVHDSTWHIRRACCTVLPSFILSLPMEMRANQIESIYTLYSADVSRSVRNAMMEVLGELIAGFEQGSVPDSLLEHFLDMGSQPMNEHELAVMCAFSFPAVILTAGRSKWELMKPVYMKLAGTFRSPIRRSLACSLHEVARILGPELADRDLSMAFSDCLMAEDEVKEGVIGHVVEFISCLSPKFRSAALRDLHSAWSDLERSSNWRLRDSLAGQLPALCEIAEGKDLIAYLIPLTVKACTDGVSTIRESGVMSFPTLWEASDLLGPFPEKVAEVSPLDLDMADDGPVMGSFGEGEDVDMEDVTNQLHTQETFEIENEKPLISFDQSDDEDESAKDLASTPAAAHSSTETDSTMDCPMTTVKDQVIRQTNEFIQGGFRTRVVAVQIIQSLLDSAISVKEFEEHFLDMLVDRLATDGVVNVRIWVSRVVTWIFESCYYNDTPVSQRLQDVLAALQQDPDRDVRIYAGGPADLPKPVKKKKKSKGKKSKKRENRQVNGSTSQSASSASSDRRVSSIVEGNEDEEPIQFLPGENDDEDEDEEEDDDEDEDSDEEDEDEEGDKKGRMGYLESAKSKVTNKPRNRNSIGIGMKVMVGNKLTVSGKEIRKPKTSWDYVHGELDEEDEVDENGVKKKSFSASLGQGCIRGDGAEDDGEDTSRVHKGENDDEDDTEGGPSLFDAPRQAREHSSDEEDDGEEEEEEEEDEMNHGGSRQSVSSQGGRSRVVPYTAGGTPSPLDVEVEEPVVDFEQQLRNHQSIAEETEEELAVVVSGGDNNSSSNSSLVEDPTLASESSALAGQGSLSLDVIATSHPDTTPTHGYDATSSPVTGTVTVNAASPPSASTSNTYSDSPFARTKSKDMTTTATKSGRSPEEQVLGVLNAKLLANAGSRASSTSEGGKAGSSGSRLGLSTAEKAVIVGRAWFTFLCGSGGVWSDFAKAQYWRYVDATPDPVSVFYRSDWWITVLVPFTLARANVFGFVEFQ
ncbi:Serine/threonine-protein phosphatase 4 regulatory subunit 1 [Gryganskiella cystojenkinii]|nr:Serine/threonine-protein phosphatase 4 regulatory subunit 1 [Gryganskiella cystojenkinii]